MYLGDTLQRDIDLVELDEIGLIYSLEEIEIVICLDGYILLENSSLDCNDYFLFWMQVRDAFVYTKWKSRGSTMM